MQPTRLWTMSIAIAALLVSAGACFLLADRVSRTLLVNTFLLVAATCAISLPVGTLLALLIVKTDLPCRKCVAVVLGVLLFVPLYLQAAAWQAGFAIQGWYTLATAGPTLLEGWRAAIWIHAVAAVPWVALIVGVGLRSVEPELEEEALLSGSAGQVFFRVTLRRALLSMLVAALWVAATTAAEMSVTDLFKVRTYAEEIYTWFNLGGLSGQQPFALWPGIAITALLCIGALLACRNLSPPMTGVSLRPLPMLPLGRGRAVWVVAVAAGLVLLAAVPLGNLAYKAGVIVVQTDEGRERSWSAVKCFSALAESPVRYEREFLWSITIAACAATAAAVIASLLAWLARGGGARTLPALLVAAAAIALPGPLLGVLLIHALNWPESPTMIYLYDKTILAPWLAQTVKALPLAILILWHALATVSREMLDEARSEGAGWIVRFFWIALPTRWPAFVGAWLVAFIVAFGELAASVLVLPPGMNTLPLQIFILLHYGVEDRVAGICLALVLLVALGFLLARFLLYRGGKST